MSLFLCISKENPKCLQGHKLVLISPSGCGCGNQGKVCTMAHHADKDQEEGLHCGELATVVDVRLMKSIAHCSYGSSSQA
jgi:hypothetical protein